MSKRAILMHGLLATAAQGLIRVPLAPAPPPRPPEEVNAKIVKHLGVTYSVVFKDDTFAFITEVWGRDKHMKWQQLWSTRSGKPPTRQMLNVSRKALQQALSLGQWSPSDASLTT